MTGRRADKAERMRREAHVRARWPVASSAVIAGELGCEASTVRRMARRLDLPRPGQERNDRFWTDAEKVSLWRLDSCGWGELRQAADEWAAAHGRTRAAALSRLQRMRAAGGPLVRPQSPPEAFPRPRGFTAAQVAFARSRPLGPEARMIAAFLASAAMGGPEIGAART